MAETDQYDGMIAETLTIQGNGGDWIHAYYARPTGPGPYPAVVLAHHMPGWDEFYREVTRKFAHHGYLALCPDLYCRAGHGSAEDMAAKVRAEGGVPDDQVVGDLEGALNYVRGQHQSNGKVGIWGTCSGGRHAMLAASRLDGLDAVADLWGGGVVMAKEDLTPARPVAPIDYTKDLSCPVLGLFGAEDRSPTPDQVAQHEAALKEQGKEYEFHTYEGAGHGFFYYHVPRAYRAEQAVDGWRKVFDFFGRHLS
ncbi:MAG: dienelactone hydrolase family protein [Dehalococcoidia bacterium]